jgi:hypothetical protein
LEETTLLQHRMPNNNKKCNIGRNNTVAAQDVPITNVILEETTLFKQKMPQE